MAAVGDDHSVALMERPWLEHVHAAPDGAEAVAVRVDVSRELDVLLTSEIGWSPARRQHWAGDAVVRAVLRPGA